MPPDFGALVRARRVPHRERRCGQAEHFEEVTASHVAGRRIAGDEPGDLAIDHGAGGGIGVSARLKEERHVPDMVKPERDKRAFDHTIDGEGERRPFVHRPVRKGLNGTSNRRPYETENRADDDHSKRSDDGDRPFAREETEVARKFNRVKTVEGCRRDQAHDDTTEDTGIDGRNAHDALGFDLVKLRANAERGQKNDITDDARERGNAIIFCEPNGHTNGEEQRQIGKDCVA